jgi:hypothetical protein
MSAVAALQPSRELEVSRIVSKLQHPAFVAAGMYSYDCHSGIHSFVSRPAGENLDDMISKVPIEVRQALTPELGANMFAALEVLGQLVSHVMACDSL